ncbi:MAG: hypothetical protein ACPHK8_07305, partial [Thermoplasmatota archaeon]
MLSRAAAFLLLFHLFAGCTGPATDGNLMPEDPVRQNPIAAEQNQSIFSTILEVGTNHVVIFNAEAPNGTWEFENRNWTVRNGELFLGFLQPNTLYSIQPFG